MQIFTQIKLPWLLLMAVFLGIVYWNIPQPPASCQSLQQYGAKESGGRCIIDKNVYLEGKIDRLPDRLTVKGNLTISGTYIEQLPAALIVEGNLYLYKTSISQIPADVQIGQGFGQDLGWGSPGVKCTDIPKTAIIKGSLRCFN